ncbi:uncharacterized protein LOC133803435 [Humulus lupulus]|uniref:uncharacterized protein LOC133803435 n=1 Tax=Humulus lupulus TaxID=3486 RepID=UPI002B40AB01|nr:uncharacterized protein LOC133803435 [Humulus lupulus]
MDMTLYLPKYSIGASNSNPLNTSNESFIRSKFPTTSSQSWSTKPTFLPLLSSKKRKELARNNGGWSIQGIDDGSCGIAPYMPPSPIGVVEEFHKHLNKRDLNKLDELLTNNCHYEDLLFYVPFEGREGVKRFFDSVIDAMGPNGIIVIDKVAEGEGSTASVFCHIEWKEKEVPFTSSCRLFECVEVEGKLLIRKITGLEELPLKPGEFVLKLLKAVTTFFDLYPFAAEAILQKSNDHSDGHGGIDKLLDFLRKKPST